MGDYEDEEGKGGPGGKGQSRESGAERTGEPQPGDGESREPLQVEELLDEVTAGLEPNQ